MLLEQAESRFQLFDRAWSGHHPSGKVRTQSLRDFGQLLQTFEMLRGEEISLFDFTGSSFMSREVSERQARTNLVHKHVQELDCVGLICETSSTSSNSEEIPSHEELSAMIAQVLRQVPLVPITRPNSRVSKLHTN